MRSLSDIRARTPKSELFRGQIQHAMIAALLTIGACTMLVGTDTTLLGISNRTWAYSAIAIALIHQSVVAVVFRLQLHLNIMVALFGERALKVWGVIFLPMLFGRPVLLLMAGLADMNTLGGNRSLQIIGGIVLLAIAGWTMHSVMKYFTINRALGGDHFYDKYLNMPLVDQGAFRYFSNAMYGPGFMGLWAIALLTGSWNAMVIALFQHAYIWVHMYCTEGPDMDIMYRDT